MHADGSLPDLSLLDAVTIDDVRRAAARLRGVAHRTPVIGSAAVDGLTGATVRMKCEHLQRVGAFKFRGAYNAVAVLRERDPGAGVLAYSSGNHAQAVALACVLLDVPCVIVMPEDAPFIKLEATRGYLEQTGRGELVTYDPGATVREELGAALAAQRGLTVIPPYDHPDVIAGQGTAALELIEDDGPPDVLFVCCGGGGLLSGCATAAKALAPACRVVGVEPELADDATRSFREGVLRTVHNPPTIADGARTPYLGRYTFPILMRRVDAMMTVTEAEIGACVRLCLERLKQVVEPSGVLALAGAIRAAREGPDTVRGRRVGVVLSGGNMDPARIPELLAPA